jgi:hypothetical protein
MTPEEFLIPASCVQPLGVDRARDEDGSHGEVFTRPWVVELILDLAGYTPDRDLALLRAIEPACGFGAFLVPMARRLSESCRQHGRSIDAAGEAIYAVDLQPSNVRIAREAVVKTLVADEWDKDMVTPLVDLWIHEGDFILGRDLNATADFVLGNPPYVRLEDIAPVRTFAYRRACPTMGGRADLFVAFYETGLRSLKHKGTLAYICADRWMHNAYGRALRAFVGDHFSVDVTIAMHDVDAFEDQVSAYPAITVIRRDKQGPALLADTTARFGQNNAKQLLKWTRGRQTSPKRTDAFEIAKLPHWYAGPDPWPAGNPEHLALIADLEERFPLLEDKTTGTRIGIGVATGADKVFVTKDSTLVEHERLLPLSMVRDTKSGQFTWTGHYLVDPWSSGSSLIDLDKYPRLRTYFDEHESDLRKRNVVQRRPRDWYRTIDRVDHSLTPLPKLLFPDMKVAMEPVYEDGGHYPHHNLYYVVSAGWDLRMLGGLLMSRIADLFVRTYTVKMRGGTLRFQAQYMRRIRVPRPNDIKRADGIALAHAFEGRDFEKATGVALRVYGLPRTALTTTR